MQGSLRGNAGPRIRQLVEEGAPYETLTVDKLTPIIGAEIGGLDLRSGDGPGWPVPCFSGGRNDEPGFEVRAR